MSAPPNPPAEQPAGHASGHAPSQSGGRPGDLPAGHTVGHTAGQSGAPPRGRLFARFWRSASRIWPRSIAGQLTGLLLVALVLSHALVTAFLLNHRVLQAEDANRRMIVLRTQSILALIATLPDELHTTVTRAASDARLTFRLEPAPTVEKASHQPLERRLLRRLLSELAVTDISAPGLATGEAETGEAGAGARAGAPAGALAGVLERGASRAREVRISVISGDHDRQGRGPGRPDRSERPQLRDGRPPLPSLSSPPSRRRALAEGAGDIVALSVQLREGQWLNVTATLAPPLQWAWPVVGSVLVMAVLIIAIVILMARRLVRPLRALSRAAEAFGRGDPPGALKAEGPSEVRQTTTAFNEMQDRLTRFIADRMRLLAAVGHDLRTPITSLRLRAEFIEDQENRDQMIATLDEMAAMVDATLSFARDDAAREAGEVIDLGASLQALTADYADLGKPVHYKGPSDVSVRCKPLSLRRAVRNLVDNALRYGGGAVEVALCPQGDHFCIDICDSGPGIDPSLLEAVFDPFMRLEASRNAATGGVGLGLSIARSVARAGGGDLILINRHSASGDVEGLTARLTLPMGQEAG